MLKRDCSDGTGQRSCRKNLRVVEGGHGRATATAWSNRARDYGIAAEKRCWIRSRIDVSNIAKWPTCSALNGGSREASNARPKQYAFEEAARIVETRHYVISTPSGRRFALCKPIRTENRESVEGLEIRKANASALSPSARSKDCSRRWWSAEFLAFFNPVPVSRQFNKFWAPDDKVCFWAAGHLLRTSLRRCTNQH